MIGSADGSTAVENVRFAIIGSSAFAAGTMVPAFLVSGADAIGVLSAGAEPAADLAAHMGVTGYRSVDELAGDPNVDAVWIAAPGPVGQSVAHVCLTAGKHVLIEQPASLSADGVRELIAAAEAHRAVLRLSAPQRFRPAYGDLHRIVAGSAIGTVRSLRLQFLSEGLAGQRRGPCHGGTLEEIGGHLLDLALWWTGGPPDEVCGAALVGPAAGAPAGECAALLLRCRGGAIATVELGTGVSTTTDMVEIQGTHGWVRGHDLWSGRGTVECSYGPSVEHAYAGFLAPYTAQLADFCTAVAGGADSGADGYAAVAVRDALDSLAVESPA